MDDFLDFIVINGLHPGNKVAAACRACCNFLGDNLSAGGALFHIRPPLHFL